ncbi:MAG: MarR family transcriptional regulator [Gemmatimonadota bacterium]|jgi:DNA-binding MarR family transcriptional regulator|nr:MarR family transcriptional regulator [Gemmatimonadota bacterium]
MASILRTAATLDHLIGDALKPYGLTGAQYNALRILRGAGGQGLCGREVGERLISQVPDVSRLLDRMEEVGLVSRERDPNDRRHVTARISDEGLRLLGRAAPLLWEIEQRRFGRLGKEELGALIELLGTVREG